MKKVIIILASLMLAAGLVFVLFEPVSTSVSTYTANKIADQFDNDLKAVSKSKTEKGKKRKNKTNSGGAAYSPSYSGGYELTGEQLDALYEASKRYNKKIFSNQGTVNTSDYTKAALNLKKYGIYNNLYGYISAPSIGLKLPIYLGANNSVMSHGAAHLCNTSLPIKGKNVNCALAGHSGYRGRVFFDNIKKLRVGSKVSVKNYWGTLHYKVIKAHTVSPDNTNDIYIRPGRNLLSMITCISAGGGKFNRFVVVCEKV